MESLLVSVSLSFVSLAVSVASFKLAASSRSDVAFASSVSFGISLSPLGLAVLGIEASGTSSAVFSGSS